MDKTAIRAAMYLACAREDARGVASVAGKLLSAERHPPQGSRDGRLRRCSLRNLRVRAAMGGGG